MSKNKIISDFEEIRKIILVEDEAWSWQVENLYLEYKNDEGSSGIQNENFEVVKKLIESDKIKKNTFNQIYQNNSKNSSQKNSKNEISSTNNQAWIKF